MKIGENETTELKASLAETKEGLISIAAILNKHKAGILWFGLKNNGKALGLEANEKTLRDLSQSIAAHIEPKIYPHITIELIDGRNCIKVSFQGNDAPYFAYGRAYMRVADEDRQLSAKELENLFLARNRDKLRWDNEATKNTSAEIDDGKLKAFLARAGVKWTSKSSVLEKLQLLRDSKIVNASLLFFSKKSNIQLRCAVFAGTSSATIIDRHDFGGDILELIEEAQKYILKNIHIGMRLDGLYREDVPEISVEALREAIINAFCHRNYRDPEHVQIAIYKDRVEIRSPGGLFGGLTIDELQEGHISRRRNPLLCELFRRIHMVEAWGRGIPLILEKEPSAKFRETAGIFITSFVRPSSKKTDGLGDKPQAFQGGQSPTQSPTQSTDPVERLLLCLEKGGMSSGDLRSFLKIKHRPTFRTNYLHPAFSKDLIEYTMPDKPSSRLQKYHLTEKGRKLLDKLKR